MKHLHLFFFMGSLSLFSLNAELSQPVEPSSVLEESSSLSQMDDSFLTEEFDLDLASLEEPSLDTSLPTPEASDATETDSIETQVVKEVAPQEAQIIKAEPIIPMPPESIAKDVSPPQAEPLLTEPALDSALTEVTSAQSEDNFPVVDEESDELESIATAENSEKEQSDEPVATLAVKEPSLIGEPAHVSSGKVTVDLGQAFSGSPIIYSILLGMSLFSLSLWFYALASIRLATQTSPSLVSQLQNQLGSNNFSEALELCQQKETLLAKMLLAGIQSRKYGMPVVIESMKSEAKRSSVFFWQKIGLLNDIAIIAPMLGLLGTVLGMFYAFYDVNRSIESISTLFDGLGISVGTTVAGLVVAILSLILHSTAKYRLVRALAQVENQAQSMATFLDDHSHIHNG